MSCSPTTISVLGTSIMASSAATATTITAPASSRRQSLRSLTRSVPLKTTSRYFSSPVTGKDRMNDESTTNPDDSIHSSTKRKANSPTVTRSKRSKKKSSSSSATRTTNAVERTNSFEPAWWGNILTLKGGTSLHSHATVAAATDTRFTNSSSFPPVHTLILGTHPSTTSLEKNELFGHPQNAFWYIAGDVLRFRRSLAVSHATGKPFASYHSHLRYGEDKIIEYPHQLERLVSKGFAIWDIVAECKREGSLDNNIKDEVPNRIREFCEGTLYNTGGDSIDMTKYLCINRIVIANGTTGGQMFVKHFRDWFLDGKLRPASDETSQRVLKAVMNQQSKKSMIKICERSIEVVCLPSVSPAAASFSYLEKRDAWEKGCYNPGLADYLSWNRSMGLSPSKQTKSNSPKKIKSLSPSKVTPTGRLCSSDLATLTPENVWIDLEIPPQELRPSATLTNGQCFNWLVVEDDSNVIAAKFHRYSGRLGENVMQ